MEVTFLLRLHLSSKNTFFFTTLMLARDSLGRGENYYLEGKGEEREGTKKEPERGR